MIMLIRGNDVRESVLNGLTLCSACGIPDNAYFQTKAAIHPYFLKYAGLDRKFCSASFLHICLDLAICRSVNVEAGDSRRLH